MVPVDVLTAPIDWHSPGAPSARLMPMQSGPSLAIVTGCLRASRREWLNAARCPGEGNVFTIPAQCTRLFAA